MLLWWTAWAIFTLADSLPGRAARSPRTSLNGMALPGRPWARGWARGFTVQLTHWRCRAPPCMQEARSPIRVEWRLERSPSGMAAHGRPWVRELAAAALFSPWRFRAAPCTRGAVSASQAECRSITLLDGTEALGRPWTRVCGTAI